jgi:hypothetical protein
MALALAAFGACASGAVGSEPPGGDQSLEMRTEILASLLAGNWIENEFFTEADFETLRLMTFRSPAMMLDHAFLDRINDPSACTVQRTWFDLSGKESRSEVVALRCDEFWQRVRYVENYRDRNGVFPVRPVDLSLVRSSPTQTPP